MTTRDFIKKTYNTTSNKERKCSSVFTDNDGVVYSYGYHYPLAFNIRGLDFINTRGYSNTTARHIAWAYQAIGYDAIGVELRREEVDKLIMYMGKMVDEQQALRIISQALIRQVGELSNEMKAKQRQDTAVYRNLEAQFTKAKANYNRVAQEALAL